MEKSILESSLIISRFLYDERVSKTRRRRKKQADSFMRLTTGRWTLTMIHVTREHPSAWESFLYKSQFYFHPSAPQQEWKLDPPARIYQSDALPSQWLA